MSQIIHFQDKRKKTVECQNDNLSIMKERVEIFQKQMESIANAILQLSSKMKHLAEIQNKIVEFLNVHWPDNPGCSCLQERKALEGRFVEAVTNMKK